MKIKKKIVCKQCGANVLFEAFAEWDSEAGELVLAQTFDSAFCPSCDGQTTPVEVELKAAK